MRYHTTQQTCYGNISLCNNKKYQIDVILFEEAHIWASQYCRGMCLTSWLAVSCTGFWRNCAAASLKAEFMADQKFRPLTYDGTALDQARWSVQPVLANIYIPTLYTVFNTKRRYSLSLSRERESNADHIIVNVTDFTSRTSSRGV